jgi:hypothetical protein
VERRNNPGLRENILKYYIYTLNLERERERNKKKDRKKERYQA